MLLKSSFDFIVGECVTSSQGLIHFHYLVCISKAHIDIKNGVLTVVDIVAVYKVGVFELVTEFELTFVVDTDCSIVVVRQNQPLAVSAVSCWERVLGTVIYHQEYFRKNVVEQHSINIAPVCELVFEFCKSFSLFFVRADCRCVGRFQPGGECRKSCCVGVLVRVSALKGCLPSITREVVVLPNNHLGIVLQYFPGLVSTLETEYLFGSFVVVEIILAEESQVASSVTVKHNHWIPLDALSYSAINELWWCFNRASIVIKHCEFYIVCTF